MQCLFDLPNSISLTSRETHSNNNALNVWFENEQRRLLTSIVRRLQGAIATRKKSMLIAAWLDVDKIDSLNIHMRAPAALASLHTHTRYA